MLNKKKILYWIKLFLEKSRINYKCIENIRSSNHWMTANNFFSYRSLDFLVRQQIITNGPISFDHACHCEMGAISDYRQEFV